MDADDCVALPETDQSAFVGYGFDIGCGIKRMWTDHFDDGREACDARHHLCDVLLQVAGRDTNRLPSVIRHVAALEAALPFMTIVQTEIAQSRIKSLEFRWGRLSANPAVGSEIDDIPPEKLMYRWASQRAHPERYLAILHRAACAMTDGETRLSVIIDQAYRYETDGLIAFVTTDSFKEWLLQLRIAFREAPAVYRPGRCCEWWATEMDPNGGKGTAYAACLKRLRRAV